MAQLSIDKEIIQLRMEQKQNKAHRETAHRKTHNDLKIYEELGAGSFGKVYRAFDPSLNKVVAVKMIEMDTSGDVDEVLLELKFLSELRCKQITNYYYSAMHDSILFVMMEYCAGGSCMHLLKQFSVFSEDSAAYVFYESLKGLEYIHSQKKIHRDLKSANILVTEDYGVKIADFGVSAQLSYTVPERNSFMGTPYWMAPEVIESDTSYDTGVDIWSMGIVLYELLTGSPPYRRLPPTEAMMRIVRNPPVTLPALERHRCSKEISQLMAACLVKDCLMRPSATKLLNTSYLKSKALPPADFKAMVDRVIHDRLGRYKNRPVLGIKDLDALAPPSTHHSKITTYDRMKTAGKDQWDFSASPLTELAENELYDRKKPQENRPKVHHHSPPNYHKQDGNGFSASSAQVWLDQAFANVEKRTSIPKCVTTIQKLHREMNEINKLYPGFNHALMQEIWRSMAPSYYQ